MTWQNCEHLYIYSSSEFHDHICTCSYACRLKLEKAKDKSCNDCMALPDESMVRLNEKLRGQKGKQSCLY